MTAGTTVGALVERTAAALEAAGVAFGHGTDNAADEAAWLVLWALRLPLEALDGHAGDAVPPAGRDAVAALLARRIETRQPLAYLTGEAWLQGVPFDADARAIVPRSLLAEVIADGTLEPFLPADGPATVLDLCTGGGSLAVLAALAWPSASVTASDVSADALALAARNLARHGLADRVRLLQGDGLAPVAGAFDLILCNPPYVRRASMQALPAEHRAEPALALAGGEDGMDFIRGLVPGAAAHLTPRGLLLLEIGHERAAFDDAFRRLQGLWLATSAGDDSVVAIDRAALLRVGHRPARGVGVAAAVPLSADAAPAEPAQAAPAGRAGAPTAAPAAIADSATAHRGRAAP